MGKMNNIGCLSIIIPTKNESINTTNYIVNDRQKCDLEILLSGAFKQLNTFLDKENYNSVLNNMRLSSGELWPIPINLDVSDGNSNEMPL